MLFQSDIAHIDIEINQLLAQVEAARQKQAALTELDALTDSSLTQLRDVVSKIGHYAPDAIASLKNAVLGLFHSGDDGDSGGNQPTPDPTPDDDPAPSADDDEPELLCLNGETGDYLLSDGSTSVEDAVPCRSCGADLNEEANYPEFMAAAIAGICRSCEAQVIEAEKKPHPHVPELNGQAYEWASHLACLLEDAPLTGQSCMWATPFASPLCSVIPSATENEDNEYKGTKEGAMPYMELLTHPENSAIAYQRKHNGEIICCYIGFRTKALASSWKQAVEVLTSNVEMRSSKRLQDFKWELKAKGLSMAQINRLASEDLNKSYRSESAESPAQAAGIEPPTGWRQVQAQAESSPTVTSAKKARITLESSPWKGQDCEVLEVTADGRWWKLRLPNGQELKYPSDTIEPVVEATEKIEFNDLVEVTADGNDCVGLVGAFGRVKIVGETRIGVEIDEQLVYFKPSELRIKAKEEKAPQRQGLQPGQVLMGDRIITSGKYIGQARISRLLNTQLGTADKIATIQLAKDLKNLGFDPRLAATVMAGVVDDASDF